MKWEYIEANWEQLRGLAKQKWNRLTDEQFRTIAGQRTRLLDWLRAKYGISMAEAELEVEEWEAIVRERERHQQR